MKRFVLILLAVALFFAFPAQADVKFSVEGVRFSLPDGWAESTIDLGFQLNLQYQKSSMMGVYVADSPVSSRDNTLADGYLRRLLVEVTGRNLPEEAIRAATITTGKVSGGGRYARLQVVHSEDGVNTAFDTALVHMDNMLIQIASENNKGEAEILEAAMDLLLKTLQDESVPELPPTLQFSELNVC